MESKKLNSKVAKKWGILLLGAMMTGGSLGQSVYAATGVSESHMEMNMKKKSQKGANLSVNVVKGDLSDINGKKSGVSWSYNLETGTLSLTGNGEPYVAPSDCPWLSYMRQITKVTMEKGVRPTNMDKWFLGCNNLKEVPEKLPDSLKSARFTFESCGMLEKAPELPNSLEDATGMFFEDYNLKKAPELPDSLRIAVGMFEGTTFEEAPELPKGLEKADDMFLRCSQLTKIKGAAPEKLDLLGKNENNAVKMFGEGNKTGQCTPTWVWYKGNWGKLHGWSGWGRDLNYYCKVNFQNRDGSILQEVDVEQGKEMTMSMLPKAPEGCHWNAQDLEKIRKVIKEDIFVRVEKEDFSVEFRDWDGRVLSNQKVKYGESAKTPAVPTRAGYTFTGWDKSYAKIVGDTVITAQYRKNSNNTKPGTNNPAAVVKPSISVTKKQTKAGKGFQIKVYRKIKGASVSFKTSNKKVASVNRSGYVKGLKAGKAIITTTVKQAGKTYSFKTNVTVQAYVKFIKVKKTIKKGKSYTFKAKAYGVSSKLKWSVSNKKIGKISSKGKFKAKKKGKVYVIVKSGKFKAKYLVKVK